MTKVEDTTIITPGGKNGSGWDAPLGKWTFQYPPARKFVEKRLSGRVLNACAGKTQLNHTDEVIRNDINPDRDADLHVDVVEIADEFETRSFDTVVFDPPFDQQQADELYDGMHATDIHKAFEQFNDLTSVGGKVITFGWNSWGMKTYDTFERKETIIFQRGPVLQDVIASVDERTINTLSGNYE